MRLSSGAVIDEIQICPKTFPSRASQVNESMGFKFQRREIQKQMFLGRIGWKESIRKAPLEFLFYTFYISSGKTMQCESSISSVATGT